MSCCPKAASSYLNISTKPSTQLHPNTLVDSLEEIRAWVTNVLKFNNNKTELMIRVPKSLLQRAGGLLLNIGDACQWLFKSAP